jgi:hypothetical protein
MVSGSLIVGGALRSSRVGVVVPVLEAHLVGVPVRVRIIAMRVFVHDVVVLMRVVWVVMPLLTVRVLMVVRSSVFVELVHIPVLPSSSALLPLRSRRVVRPFSRGPFRHG